MNPATPNTVTVRPPKEPGRPGHPTAPPRVAAISLATILPAALAIATLLPAAEVAESPSATESPSPTDRAEPEPIADDDCLACHGSTVLRKVDGERVKSLHVSPKALAGSVHRRLACVSCHADVAVIPHPEGVPIRAGTCLPCHDEAVELHATGVHGGGGIKGDRDPLPCGSCHGSPHEILSSEDPKSPTFRPRIPETCAGCHSDLRMVVENLDPSLRKPFFAYTESVHGRAVAGGSAKAAVCTDCHRSHDILPPFRELSSINRFQVPATCGECHEEVFKVYAESVHGAAVSQGSSRSPVCTDCHGIHSIRSPLDPTSTVANQVIARTTCPQCHESLAVTQEIGISADRLRSYLNSYHGLALRRGSKVVANCASCHGVHDIFKSSDARSTVHPDRLPQTCGTATCHPGAGPNFTRGKIHEVRREDSGIGATLIPWVERLYLFLIVATIGAMLVHNGLDLRKKSDPRHRFVPPAHLHEERLSRNQRIQHAILASSFITLVLTGFALHAPESWLSRLFGPGDETRRLIHRATAVVMVLLGGYHVVYLFGDAEGRRALRQLAPGIRDLRIAAAQIAYYLGWRAEPPEATHFGYAEKLEYWAVIWGTIVMAVTGFLLWFKLFATGTLGLDLWVLDLARVIHYYEAWLATLAIIVWHLYFVIFDPAVYPMNWGWLTGWVKGKHGLGGEAPRREGPGAPRDDGKIP